MSKIGRIIQLLNLLYHRQSVTIDKIKEQCGISERTVYRYMRSISEANVPVYFDKGYGGFRINKSIGPDIGGWIPSEVALIIAALQYFANELDNGYRGELETLIERIISQQNLPFEQFWQSWKQSLSLSQKDLESLRTLLTSTLISFAVDHSRKVCLNVSEIGNQEPHSFTISDPVLRFKGEWIVSENKESGNEPIPVSGVSSAKVL